MNQIDLTNFCSLNDREKPTHEFIVHREKLWNEYKQNYTDFVASQPRSPISVTFPDGTVVEAKAWETTPFDLAQKINKKLADSAVIARVNGKLWDLLRPLESDVSLELLNFDHKDGRYVFWHSSAHILGEAIERLFGSHLCYGPPIEEGFYYDAWNADRNETHSGFKPDDLSSMEKMCQSICQERQPFERLELSKQQLLDMFAYNKFKVRILKEKVTQDRTTVYKCGTLIDLCLGPHVRHTGCVKALAVTKSSSSYWQGQADAEQLQRVYGISFPDAKQLKQWQHLQAEAAKRDHRKLGMEQKLFFFHEMSPGSCFFLPAGAHIYNTLVSFIRSEYWRRGFQEVITPNIYSSQLWKTSGHWEHYSENMFKIDIEKQCFGLKPMNCPGHCLMFAKEIRSHRDLPLRLADFGVLHRNEFSGALSGLTRVRRFQQDDAHIFCRPDQVKDEIKGCLDFLTYVYETFGFTFELNLSTRPEKFMGNISLWDLAESELKQGMDELELPWELNEGDGAFYGPKIDIILKDALGRRHQCATIQLDFQLPIRFDLTYASAISRFPSSFLPRPHHHSDGDSHSTATTTDSPVTNGESTSSNPTTGGDPTTVNRPVIIHRAILGSVERLMAILTESYAGKWPLWLSPRQVLIVPVASRIDEYANQVKKCLHKAGFMVQVDTDPGRTLNKKIRNGQVEQFNFILVVGDQEVQNGTVNVRTRNNRVHGEHSLDHVIDQLRSLCDAKTPDAEDKFN